MKKILVFMVLSVLFFGCENNGLDTSANSVIAPTTDNTTQTDQLGSPLLMTTPGTPSGLMHKMVDGQLVWYIHFSTIKDINDIEIPGAVIWTMHTKVPAEVNTIEALTAFCAAYKAQSMNCGDGIVYPGDIGIPNGNFCLKGIACADGYLPSDLITRQISVSGGGLEGDSFVSE